MSCAEFKCVPQEQEPILPDVHEGPRDAQHICRTGMFFPDTARPTQRHEVEHRNIEKWHYVDGQGETSCRSLAAFMVP